LLTSGNPQRPSHLTVTGGHFRRPGRGHTFLGSHQFPHHLILPHGLPGTLSGNDIHAFRLVTPGVSAASSGLLATPVSYGEDRASRPPPLQHRVLIRAASNSISRVSANVGLIQIALGLFQSQAGQSWEQTRTPGLATAPFQPHGFLDISYEPLYVTLQSPT